MLATNQRRMSASDPVHRAAPSAGRAAYRSSPERMSSRRRLLLLPANRARSAALGLPPPLALTQELAPSASRPRTAAARVQAAAMPRRSPPTHSQAARQGRTPAAPRQK